ncbi:MAG TPA: signal recognition particle-docking protein FtsY [Polyangiaceae bacterium]|nr:signal recognition particle-docking protein FtsY [Polyangiaceae bacterium]
MTTVAIVVALIVVVAVVVAALARAKGTHQLSPPSSQAKQQASTRRSTPSDRAPTLPTGGAPEDQRAKSVPRMGLAPESLPASALVPDEGKASISGGARVPQRDVANLRKGLAVARGGFIAKLSALFQNAKEFDPAVLAQVEEIMLTSDVGPKTTTAILARLRESLGRNELRSGESVWAALREESTRILAIGGGGIRITAKPTVTLMVGVNGVGKTTTIGKLATRYSALSKKVVLAAGDTFRAAAVQQLEVWGKRVGAEVIRGKEGADPGAVAFDATNRAKEGGADLLFVDTAGRLHTKAPLMDEIKKVRRTIGKAMEGAPHETLLVLDGTTGQNALQQAVMFRDALDLTGIVLTKLDGTAKGGIVLAICDELRVPVRYVGLGERAEDLREFQADEFVEALFGRGDEDVAAA